uniref:Protein translocase subunit SecE n=1 Tax=Candidatus Aschnera chinzeii TaxID=1485666 RepID=A0AAT9G3Y0_9ENTR|nr:MAG: preprotein translocase subunit SecE [Candidatus Aschnera chinzeii]
MNINNNIHTDHNNYDIFKWIIATTCLLIAIISNFYFKKYNIFLQIIITTLLILSSILIGLRTKSGKLLLLFAREAYIELKKVIWPTYYETLQMTLIIIAVAIIIALILWGLDTILVRVVSFIINMRF